VCSSTISILGKEKSYDITRTKNRNSCVSPNNEIAFMLRARVCVFVKGWNGIVNV
jgi:hypothetical protein